MWFRALTALSKDLGLVSSTHITARYCPYTPAPWVQWPLLALQEPALSTGFGFDNRSYRLFFKRIKQSRKFLTSTSGFHRHTPVCVHACTAIYTFTYGSTHMHAYHTHEKVLST